MLEAIVFAIGMAILVGYMVFLAWSTYDMAKAVQDYLRTMKWLDSLEREEERW